MYKAILFVILGAGLLACESSVNPPPPDIPTVIISGSSSIMSGDLVISTFGGTKEESLTAGKTTSNGSFVVSIKTDSGPITVCISNGVYYEAATSASIPMVSGQLCAVVNYQMGAAIDVSVNYFTHLAYALASYLTSQGQPATKSVLDANKRINNLLEINVSKVQAIDIRNEVNNTSFATDQHLLGIAVAGLSALTGDSVGFSQVMFEDVRVDGLLDGVGDNSTQLSAGAVTIIGTETYRHDLALAMYESINSGYNKTGLDGGAIQNMVSILNGSDDAMFGATVSVPLNSTIKGSAFNSLITDGNVTVFDFANGVKGRELATGVIDQNGQYSVEVIAYGAPALLEMTGARYTEEASGENVAFQISSDHILRAVVIHKPEGVTNTSVSTWTNIAVGLMEYRISQGLDATYAISESNSNINSVLGLDALTTVPVNITDINNAATLNDKLIYGFFGSGLSQFTYDAGVAAQETVVHQTINSINFSVMAYDDIKSDGLLDGQGSKGALTFANTAIDANTYRHSISQGIIRMASNIRNQSGLTPLALLPAAKRLNDSTHSIFGSLPTIVIDEGGPMVSQFSPASGVYNKGAFTVSAAVTDLLGVTEVELLAFSKSYGFANDLSNIRFNVDTLAAPSPESDCFCDITIRATNIAGTTTDSMYKVQVDNRRFMYFYHYPNSPTPITNLSPVSVSPINGRIHSHDTSAGSSLFMGNTSLLPLTMHPSDRFGYFFDNSTFDLVKYDMDTSTGSPFNRVVLEAGVSVNSVGRGYHFSKDGQFLFKLRDERVRQDGINFISTVIPSSISSYSVANDGKLTYLSKIDVPHGPIMMANNPILDVVYVPQWEADSIGIYKIQQNGSLIPLPGAPAITGNSPRYIAVDAYGKYAYIAFGLENVIKKYRFSPEGWLIFETSYATGATPRTIQIHNDGKILYVANFDGTLNVFNINQSTGRLTQTAESPLTISSRGMRGMYLDAASEYAIFWGSFGAMTAPVNTINGSIGFRISLFNANGQPVLPPMLTRGSANAQP